MGRISFQKRQKEMKRQEKRQRKAEKRAQRKLAKSEGAAQPQPSETQGPESATTPTTGADTDAI